MAGPGEGQVPWLLCGHDGWSLGSAFAVPPRRDPLGVRYTLHHGGAAGGHLHVAQDRRQLGEDLRVSIHDAFDRFAKLTARLAGSAVTFGLAAAVIVVWAVSGPLFGFSDTWQLVINTGTTIVTFLMVFLIQNSSNRDTLALQAKVDQLIRATEGASNRVLGLEERGAAEQLMIKQAVEGNNHSGR
jgi:low affinity Fe/Cu permease